MNILKKILPLLSVLAVVAIGCDDRRPPHHLPEKMAADSAETNHDLAFRLASENKPFEVYMPVQLRAVGELRSGRPQKDAVDILAQTGQMYMRHGDYMEALEFLQEASDSLKRRDAAGVAPLRSSIRLHGNIAGLYFRLGMYEEALEENALALALSRRLDNADGPDLWRMRGEIFRGMLDENGAIAAADSALRCYDMALEVIASLPDREKDAVYRAKANTSRADLFISYPRLYADSIQQTIGFLESALPANYPNRLSQMALLGRGYVLSGLAAKGLPLLEEALADFRSKDDKESADWTLDLLAQSYAQAGHAEKLAGIYSEEKAYRDSLFNSKKINAVLSADFRYRLREKQKEAAALRQKNDQSRRIIIYEAVALAAGLIVGAVLMFFAIAYRRKMMAEKRAQKSTIDKILAHQQILNSTIETLNERIEREKDTNVVAKVLESLDPALLSGDDENEFRRAFASLHPQFLPKLRADFPTITTNDELLCMLIYLDVPASDMAATLGISRPSLNSARYRIRKKLNLDKEADLDLFLQSR